MKRFLVLAVLLSACTTTLEQGLSEPQADEIVVALGTHGIGATKEAPPGARGFEIRVATSDVATALALLRERGLPRVETPGLAETFAEPSLVPTAGEERARTSVALAADLARSIETLDGVDDARVHIGLPDPSVIPMEDAPPAVAASVLVHAVAGAHVDEAAIRALVAGAIPGLAPDHVAVVVVAARVSAIPSEPLVAVGPVFVSAGTANVLRGLLAALLAVNVALAVGIGVVLRRRR